jgi:hypothetical protein
MFQSAPVAERQRRSEEVTPLPNVIIPLKGEVSNQSQFSMNAVLQEAPDSIAATATP